MKIETISQNILDVTVLQAKSLFFWGKTFFVCNFEFEI